MGTVAHAGDPGTDCGDAGGASDCALSFPPTAWYFITAAAASRLQRRENLLPIASAQNLELAIAAATTHAA